MRHKTFFLFCLALLVLPGVAGAQGGNGAAVRKAEAYLNNLSTAKADFIQTTSTGGRTSGTFYLDRPGKLRFEYNESDDFIVADGNFIFFYDAESGEQTNAPIGQTLADFLLRKDLRLSGDLQVSQVYSKDGYTSITMAQSDDPGAGQVELIFNEVPYRLVKWRVLDPTGEATEITLKNLETGMKLPVSLFRYVDPQHGKTLHYN